MSNSSNSIETARQPWEALDNDLEENTVQASPELSREIDDALGLQMISIRLQRALLSQLKAIAEYRGVGYQPLIRDLLNRFAKSEVQTILNEIEEQQLELQRLNAATKDAPAMESVDRFLARELELKRA